MSKVFDANVRYYDLLYCEKDYIAEADWAGICLALKK